jgi:hypothetical protein
MATKETRVSPGPACLRIYNNNVIAHVVDRNMNESGGSGPPATPSNAIRQLNAHAGFGCKAPATKARGRDSL